MIPSAAPSTSNYARDTIIACHSHDMVFIWKLLHGHSGNPPHGRPTSQSLPIAMIRQRRSVVRRDFTKQ